MTKILNANDLEKCSDELVKFMISRSNKNRNPKLVILVASDDKASDVYVRNKVKMGEKFGIDVVVEKFAMFVKDEEIKGVIE